MKSFKTKKHILLLAGIVIVFLLVFIFRNSILSILEEFTCSLQKGTCYLITQNDDGKTMNMHIGEKIIVKTPGEFDLYSSDSSILQPVFGLSQPSIGSYGPKSSSYLITQGIPILQINKPGTTIIQVQHDCMEASCETYTFTIKAIP